MQRLYAENNGIYEVVKVLVCGPRDGHTFDYIYWSLQEMGHEAKILDSRYEYETLFDEVKGFMPDFLLIPRQGHLYEQVKKVKEETSVKVYLWNTDSRGSFQGYKEEFGEGLVRLFGIVDCTYNVAIGEVEMFRKEGFKSEWLIQGICPGIDNKPSGRKRYEHEISFQGSLNGLHESQGGRITMLRQLHSAGFTLNLEQCYGAEASAVYYLSRINIGHAHSPLLGENSVRDFKIMGSGGFLLTQYYRGIEDILSPPYECVTYRTPEECVEKAKYYLEHEEEREMIAQNGYESAHSEHKYSDRLKTILRDHKNGM